MSWWSVRTGWWVMAAQMKPASSRATAATATVERLRWLGEVPVAVVQADLRLPGARVDGAGDGLGERAGADGSAWWVLVVPGGLDQQPPGVAVAGLGELPAVLAVA